MVYSSRPTLFRQKRIRHRNMKSLPMASPFNPFSASERTIMAFTGGASFALGSGTSAPLISQIIQYGTGSTYCFPACMLISYSLSVGVGLMVSTKIGGKVSSYFLESYRSKWQAENVGKYFIEKGILKQVPPLVTENSLPKGLAFVTSLRSIREGGSGIYELIQRIVVVNSVAYIVGFIIKKSKEFVSLGLTKFEKSSKIKQYKSFTKVNLDGLDIYHKLVGEI